MRGLLGEVMVAFGLAATVVLHGATALAEIAAEEAVVFFNFSRGTVNLAPTGGKLVLRHGLGLGIDACLEFTTPRQEAEMDGPGMVRVSGRLKGVRAMTVGGWFQCRRVGEQVILGRGEMGVGSLGERLFRPSDRFISFCLGTDERGLLMGTINGNGSMPFPHVTVNDVPIVTWQQLVVVKTPDGYHHFYQNGTLIHTDKQAMSAPSRQPWLETDAGPRQPIRLRMPAVCPRQTVGLIGEAWVFGRAVSAEEVAADYRMKKSRYKPAPPGKPVLLREMHRRPPAEIAFNRDRAIAGMMALFGPFPNEKVALDPKTISQEDCGSYLRRKVSLRVQPNDRMPAYLLIPKQPKGPVPGVICFYGTTSGAGKLTTVVLSGRRPGDPPHPNLSFAVDIVEAGFVALAPDYLRDGERIHQGDTPYDTTRFYKRFPDWSIHGKDVWDTMRAIDYLETLESVDAERIGMVGHSYGGHSTIFAAALEPRIRVAPCC